VSPFVLLRANKPMKSGLADFCLWQIVLQKSKIGPHLKSRESRFSGDSAAAILCGDDTKLRGRFSDER